RGLHPGTLHGGYSPAVLAQGPTPLARVLLSLAVIMAVAQLLGAACRRLGQPPVMGEVLGGILLGPSLLGWLWPAGYAALLPESLAPAVGLLAKVGVILYLFFVGLELNTDMLRHQVRSTVAISHASILLPFLLGCLLGLHLYPVLGTADVPFLVFSLFLGVSMSVTAFPVLARILTDQSLHRTPVGALALACAAVNDVTAWCLLALVAGVAQADLTGAGWTLAGLLLFALGAVFVVRPLLLRLVRQVEEAEALGTGTLGLFVILMVASAWCTEMLGVHALFGAFVAGAIIPHESLLARELRVRLHDLAAVLFLPAFFAFTGMRTHLGLLHTGSHVVMSLLILAAACLGKFGGTYLAARFTGWPALESAVLGVLMNTRGLMELIVLNLGLEMKILSPTLFTMLVLMALVTTFATGPLLTLLGKGPLRVRANHEGCATSPGSPPTRAFP
ncbi:MAG: cation:proton antiporter, partial [Candidatus Eremiobacterota bacterium]